MFFTASIISWNHVHPVLVHFTTALLPVSFASDAVGKFTDRYSLTPAAWWMLFYGALATPLTALAGWLWANDINGGLGSMMTIHKWLGGGLALSFIFLGSWRGLIFYHGKKPSTVYFLIASVIIAALMYQGYLGGKMTLG